MSPEQVRSTKSVDARTDVWALGVILYEMLTGAPAFQGETLGDIFAKIREEDLTPIRDRRPDVPEGLAAVLAHCLQRDREKRLADAVTMRRALLPFAAGAGEISLPPATVGARVPSIPNVTLVEDDSPRRTVELSNAATLAAPSTGDADEPTPPPGAETLATWSGEHGGHRRSRILAGGALALSAAIGLVAWMALRSSGPPPAPPGPLASSPATTDGSAVPAVNAAPGSSATPVVTPVEPAPLPSASALAPPPAIAPVPPSRTTHVVPPVHPSAVPTATKKKKDDLGI
jgi:serine/threonine-protein kinase